MGVNKPYVGTIDKSCAIYDSVNKNQYSIDNIDYRSVVRQMLDYLWTTHEHTLEKCHNKKCHPVKKICYGVNQFGLSVRAPWRRNNYMMFNPAE